MILQKSPWLDPLICTEVVDGSFFVLLYAGKQFVYTSVFGVFTVFVFMSTGDRWHDSHLHILCSSSSIWNLSPQVTSWVLLCAICSATVGMCWTSALPCSPLRDQLSSSPTWWACCCPWCCSSHWQTPFFHGAASVCSLAPPLSLYARLNQI